MRISNLSNFTYFTVKKTDDEKNFDVVFKKQLDKASPGGDIEIPSGIVDQLAGLANSIDSLSSALADCPKLDENGKLSRNVLPALQLNEIYVVEDTDLSGYEGEDIYSKLDSWALANEQFNEFKEGNIVAVVSTNETDGLELGTYMIAEIAETEMKYRFIKISCNCSPVDARFEVIENSLTTYGRAIDNLASAIDSPTGLSEKYRSLLEYYSELNADVRNISSDIYSVVGLSAFAQSNLLHIEKAERDIVYLSTAIDNIPICDCGDKLAYLSAEIDEILISDAEARLSALEAKTDLLPPSNKLVIFDGTKLVNSNCGITETLSASPDIPTVDAVKAVTDNKIDIVLGYGGKIPKFTTLGNIDSTGYEIGSETFETPTANKLATEKFVEAYVSGQLSSIVDDIDLLNNKIDELSAYIEELESRISRARRQ